MLSWIWLFGPSGSGKTAVGYELFRQLADGGHRIAYVEIDQLGMCMPVAEEAAVRIKVENLLAVLDNFERVGVDGVVVSGDIAGSPMEDVIRRAGSPGPVLCRLCADIGTIEERLRSRGAPAAYLESARAYEAQFASPADLVVDTTRLTIADVAAQIRSIRPGWPPRSAGNHATVDEAPPVPGRAPDVVLVCGPRAVGKSAVAWQVLMHCIAAGVPTAYLDLAQVRLVEGSSREHARAHLGATNVAACWRTFASEGAQRLVLSGEVEGEDEIEAYRRALPGSRITVVVLTADVEVLSRRAIARGAGHGVQLPGDDLRGRAVSELQSVVRTAVQEMTGSPLPPHDLYLDTSELSIEETSEIIVRDVFAQDGRDA